MYQILTPRTSAWPGVLDWRRRPRLIYRDQEAQGRRRRRDAVEKEDLRLVRLLDPAAPSAGAGVGPDASTFSRPSPLNRQLFTSGCREENGFRTSPSRTLTRTLLSASSSMESNRFALSAIIQKPNGGSSAGSRDDCTGRRMRAAVPTSISTIAPRRMRPTISTTPSSQPRILQSTRGCLDSLIEFVLENTINTFTFVPLATRNSAAQ